MPKMQLYLPDDLYDAVKALGPAINVSSLLQDAVTRHLDERRRELAAAAAVADYEAECGAFTQEELDRIAAAAHARAVNPTAHARAVNPTAHARAVNPTAHARAVNPAGAEANPAA